jgi:hypothetical protein
MDLCILNLRISHIPSKELDRNLEPLAYQHSYHIAAQRPLHALQSGTTLFLIRHLESAT